MKVHLQPKEGQQQPVRNQEEPHDALQPSSCEHHRCEESRDAHEAVAEDIDGVEERIEGREQKCLDALDVAPRKAGAHPGELHKVHEADEHGVRRGECHRGVTLSWEAIS
jgi:hypothetical protein